MVVASQSAVVVPGDRAPTRRRHKPPSSRIPAAPILFPTMQLFDRPSQLIQRLTGRVGGHDRIHRCAKKRSDPATTPPRSYSLMVLPAIPFPYFEH